MLCAFYGLTLCCMAVGGGPVFQAGSRRLADIHPQRVQPDGGLEEVLVALGLCLGLYPAVPPHIYPVSLDEDGVGFRVILNGFPQTGRQLALPRCVLNDGHHALIKIAVASDPLPDQSASQCAA